MDITANFVRGFTFCGIQSSVLFMDLSPSTDLIATSHYNKYLEIRNLQNQTIQRRIYTGGCGDVTALSWRRFYHDLVTASSDKIIRVWDVKSGVDVYKIDEYPSYCCAVHPEGNLIASGSDDEYIRLWDVRASKAIHSYKGFCKTTHSIDFSMDGETFVTLGEDNHYNIWNLRNDDAPIRFRVGGDDDNVRGGIFINNGENVITSEPAILKMWSSSTGEIVKEFVGHISNPNNTNTQLSVAQQRFLVMGSNDNNIYIWDISTGELVQILKGHTDKVLCTVAHSVRNIIVSSAVNSDKTIKIWKNIQEDQEWLPNF